MKESTEVGHFVSLIESGCGRLTALLLVRSSSLGSEEVYEFSRTIRQREEEREKCGRLFTLHSHGQSEKIYCCSEARKERARAGGEERGWKDSTGKEQRERS